MSISVSTTIGSPPSEVWRYLQDIERHTEWMADAESIAFLTDARQGAGTRFECLTKVGPIRLNDVMEITSWEPVERMGVRHQGLVTGEGEFTLTPWGPDGTQTRFDWSETLQFPWWLGGPVAELLSRPVLGAIWRSNLKRLRANVEAQAS